MSRGRSDLSRAPRAEPKVVRKAAQSFSLVPREGRHVQSSGRIIERAAMAALTADQRGDQRVVQRVGPMAAMVNVATAGQMDHAPMDQGQTTGQT